MKKCDYNVTIIMKYSDLDHPFAPITGAAGTAAYDQIRQGRDVDVTVIDTDGSLTGVPGTKGRIIVRREYIGYVMFERTCEEVTAPTDANCKEE